jgi:uncharacterized protein YjiS (DUF1127 family)
MSTIDTIQRGLGGATAVTGPGVSAFTYKALVGVEAFFNRLALVAERRRTRQALMSLNDHQLRDIGVTRDEAMREASRPMWY